MKDSDLVIGHKPGLFVLFFTEMWERFSYYGMRALFVLFLISDYCIDGWQWNRADAILLYGIYTWSVYMTPIVGGILADKVFGHRNAVVIGAIMMTLGHGSLALETEYSFYLGLILLIFGNGMFKPNISSMVGELYKKEVKKKDSAYTIFYMGINAGAFLGILFCGYIGEKIGWSLGFGLAGVFMLFGLLQFYFSQKIFGDIGVKQDLENRSKEEIKEAEEEFQPQNIVSDRLIVIGVLSFFTIFFWWAFEQAGGSMTIFARDYTERVLTGGGASIYLWADTALTLIPLIIVTAVLILLFRKTFRTITLSNMFLGLSILIIWLLAIWKINKEFNNQAYSVSYVNNGNVVQSNLIIDEEFKLNDKINVVFNDDKLKYVKDPDEHKERCYYEGTVIANLGSKAEVPASWFGILNSFFIIAFAPFFSKVWESKYNPSGPQKFALGLILLGIGFAALAYGGLMIPKGAATASVSMIWLIVAYLFHTLGELCISPVGLSYVSKLAPARLVGLMFGVFFFATSLANLLGALTGRMIDDISREYSISGFFLIFTIIPILAAIVMLILNPWLKKKMHGIK